MDVALTAVREDTSTLEDEAAAGATGVRGFSPWVAWKRDTFVLSGAEAGGDSTGGVSGRSRSKMAGPGVGGGEMKATFFWTSVLVLCVVLVVLEVVPLEATVALREIGPGYSGSGGVGGRLVMTRGGGGGSVNLGGVVVTGGVGRFEVAVET